MSEQMNSSIDECEHEIRLVRARNDRLQSERDALDRLAERMTDRNAQLRRFALRLLDPEDLGYAATPYIRDAAREVLGMKPVEVANVSKPQ